MKHYYYGRQLVDENDITAVATTLRSDYLSQGPCLEKFEEKVAEYCNAQYCLAVSNGTTALHLACLALGVKSGDTGWTSPLSFVASANCIRYCGAEANFIDIDKSTLNMSVVELAKRLEQAANSGTLPKVLIPVHFAGAPCDMPAIRALSDKYGFTIIEDACHALGGQFEEGTIGNCKHSEITVFSLHPVKSITTGEGGLILTNSKSLYQTMKGMRTHGLVRGEACADQNHGPWHVEMGNEGFNYKISEFQCALGISQLHKLDEYVSARRKLAAIYKENLKDTECITFQSVHNPEKSAWHLMIALFDFQKIGKSKRMIYEELAEKGIYLSCHYYPIHLNPPYRHIGFKEGMFPVAERYYDQTFSLPLHPSLTPADVMHICAQIRDVCHK